MSLFDITFICVLNFSWLKIITMPGMDQLQNRWLNFIQVAQFGDLGSFSKLWLIFYFASLNLTSSAVYVYIKALLYI